MPTISKCASIVYRFGHMFFDEHLEENHIGSGQQFFLLHLYEHPGISQEELAHIDHYDKGTTARAVKKLEQEGYILRKSDERDRRFMKLYVTKEGETLVFKIQKIIQQWNEMLSAGLEEEEKTLVSKLMEKIAHNAQQYGKQK